MKYMGMELISLQIVVIKCIQLEIEWHIMDVYVQAVYIMANRLCYIFVEAKRQMNIGIKSCVRNNRFIGNLERRI
jgi:hypothetical protein